MHECSYSVCLCFLSQVLFVILINAINTELHDINILISVKNTELTTTTSYSQN